MNHSLYLGNVEVNGMPDNNINDFGLFGYGSALIIVRAGSGLSLSTSNYKYEPRC